MKVAYHGLGYVGLTGAVHFALAGVDVIGFDPDPAIAEAVNSGTPKHGEFLSYLGDKLGAASGHLRATTQFADTLVADVHIIAVPTERKGEPLSDIVFDVLTKLWLGAKDGAVVLIESTLAPGTIDTWLRSLATTSSTRTVTDIGTAKFHLAVCPRRDWFADQSKSLLTLPRIVGGITPLSTEMAVDVLSTVSTKILRTTYRTAEITKALENALLHVPLMFVHQLAMALPEHDVAEAVRLAGTHWRLMPLYLNVGTGGRCVPLGSKYLLGVAGETLAIGKAVVDAEEEVRRAAAVTMRNQVGHGIVAVLGIAYRPGFRDMGLSPGLDVAKHLHKTGNVVIHDPMWTDDELVAMTGLETTSLDRLGEVSGIVLATPHADYHELPERAELWRKGQVVLDAQGAWMDYRELFAERGVRYVCVGEPGWLK